MIGIMKLAQMRNSSFLLLFLMIIRGGNLYSQQTENVVIAVIDGARYTETFGDPTHQYIPRIWNDLRPQGTIFTSFYNDGITQTNSGHSTILTGTWQSILNDGGELPHKPTLFEYFRKEKNSPASENYVVLGKTKLDILAFSDHADYGASYGGIVDTTDFQYDDVYTLENVKDVITTFHPRLMITNLAATDRAGHDGPWSNYTEKLQRADSIVNELWNFIQADPTYSNKTTLIITNDHGRHTTDFRSHGDGCDGCRHISLLMLGPDTPIDKIEATRYTQVDIAPTIGRLLNFNTYYSTGNIITPALTLPSSETYSIQSGWNIISVPKLASSMLKTELFPSAISSAYSYNGSYLKQDTLENGVGYWIKFPSSQDFTITGLNIETDTIDVVEGWNLIGSLTIPIPITNIGSSSANMILSQFFRYSTNYIIADTLQPCRGYWVKSNQSGQLFLNPIATAHPVAIISENENPPPPPHQEGSSIIEKSYSLKQNYPNPFNPATNFQFTIANYQLTILKVYDVLGREVATLLNEVRQPGEYNVNWNASGFPSGFYYYRLQVYDSDESKTRRAATFDETKKLILMK